MKRLSPKQESFCMAYAKSGNATEAYKKAYPSTKNDKTAQAASSRLLSKVIIKARLDAIRAEIASSKIMQPKEMQEWLTKILRGEVDDRDNPALLKDKLKAADLLGKMQGAFISRQEVDIKGAVPVVLRDDVNG